MGKEQNIGVCIKVGLQSTLEKSFLYFILFRLAALKWSCNRCGLFVPRSLIILWLLLAIYAPEVAMEVSSVTSKIVEVCM